MMTNINLQMNIFVKFQLIVGKMSVKLACKNKENNKFPNLETVLPSKLLYVSASRLFSLAVISYLEFQNKELV